MVVFPISTPIKFPNPIYEYVSAAMILGMWRKGEALKYEVKWTIIATFNVL